MSVLIRVDVDNPYQSSSRLERAMNLARNDLDQLFPALPSLGYLRNLRILSRDIQTRGLRASFFFRRSTVPTPEIAEALIECQHAIGFHATRTDDARSFKRDLAVVKRHLARCRIRGLTKHGSGTLKLGLRHTPTYDEDRLIALASKASLEYFSGNGQSPSERPRIADGILCFPSAFWLDPDRRSEGFDMDWLVNESATRDVVVLVHPREYVVKTAIKELFEDMVDRVDRFSTFDEVTDENNLLPHPARSGECGGVSTEWSTSTTRESDGSKP